MNRAALLCICAALVGCAAGTTLVAEKAPERSDRAASLAAFDTVASVLTSPRCINCHTVTAFPRQGDDGHPHQLNVQRGDDGHGVPAQRCTTCHGRANNVASGVPGADEDWHLAPLGMGWEGLSRGELCVHLKDPARNGGRNGEAVIDHLHTKLVQWAWSPGIRADGSARAVPPVDYATFIEAAQTWVRSGAACPR